MKITASKLFEAFQLGDAAAKIEPLVSYLNGTFDQLIKALQGRITIRDNVFSEIRELQFAGVATGPRTQTFTPAQRTVEGIVLLQTQAADGNTVASWRWAFLASGAIEITVYPREQAPNAALTAKFAILFQ